MDLPFIQTITLQSNNANSYQKIFLICAIAFLNACYDSEIRVSSFIHTETQNGKTSLDAHFARCMRFLSHFMITWIKNKMTRINTPNGLGFALAWNGGMTNVMVHVAKINRQFVAKIQQLLEPITRKRKQYFTRVNNIDYTSKTKIDMNSENKSVGSILKSLKFTVGVQAYSNIGPVCKFTVDGADNTVTIRRI